MIELQRANAISSWDCLKIIALFAMILDHLGHYLFPEQLWLRALGRVAMPLFLFLVGYASPTRFKPSLVIWALIAAGTQYGFGFGIWPLNILFAILICRALLEAFHRPAPLMRGPYLWILPLLAIYPLTSALFDYGTMALLFALFGYTVRHEHGKGADGPLFGGIVCVLYVVVEAMFSDYRLPEIALISVLVLGCWKLLSGFEVKQYSWTGPLPRAAKFLARHSLEFYVLHRAALEGVAWWLAK